MGGGGLGGSPETMQHLRSDGSFTGPLVKCRHTAHTIQSVLNLHSSTPLHTPTTPAPIYPPFCPNNEWLTSLLG